MKGIYCIRNRINSKRYIGKSVDIEARTFMFHRDYDESLSYRNDHLKNSIRKYGIENFEVEVLEECDEYRLNEREIYWIDYYKSYDPTYGYNKTFGGDGGNFNEEIKEKISKTLREKYSHENHYMLGFRHTEETKRMMSERRKGKPVIPEGSHLSDETKEKLSRIRSGRVWMNDSSKEVFVDSDEIPHYESLGYQRGRLIKGTHYHPEGLSEETRQKLRESALGKKYPGRKYNLVCKSCNSPFLGTSPRQYHCNLCMNKGGRI